MGCILTGNNGGKIFWILFDYEKVERLVLELNPTGHI